MRNNIENQEHLPVWQHPMTEVLAQQICQLQNVLLSQSLLCCEPEPISANPESPHQLMVFRWLSKEIGHTTRAFLFEINALNYTSWKHSSKVKYVLTGKHLFCSTSHHQMFLHLQIFTPKIYFLAGDMDMWSSTIRQGCSRNTNRS
jgi:hypothetical protein